MKKLFLAFGIFLASLCASPAQMMQDIVNGGSAATACGNCMSSPIFVTPAGSPSASATNYAPFGTAGSWNSTVSVRSSAWPISGTISNLNVVSLTTIATNGYTFTLNIAGSNTALLCSVGVSGSNLGTTTTCSDSTDNIGVTQGQLVAMQSSVPGGTATTFTAAPKITATFTSNSGQQSPINLGLGLPSTSAINYLGPLNLWQTSDALASWVMPTAGTINNLFGQLGTAAGAGKNWQFTVFQNGNATAIVAGDATHCGGASVVQCSDTTDSIAVAALDTISIQICPSAVSPLAGNCPTGSAPAASNITATLNFTPTTSNQAIVIAAPTSTMPGTSTANNFTTFAGSASSAGTQENLLQNVAPVLGSHMTLGGLTVGQCPGPGAAVTRTVTLRDAAASKTPTATVAVGTTACPTLSTIQDNTHTYQATSSSLLDFLTAPSATSTALTEFKTSMWVTVP